MTKKKKTNKTTNTSPPPTNSNITNTNDIPPVIPEKTRNDNEKMVHFDISTGLNDSTKEIKEVDHSFIVNPEFKARSKKVNEKFYPIVSVCTPTFNRRPFIQTMFECFKNQDYPKSAIEWIIVDDGTDPIEDLMKTSEIENIKYYRLSKKIPLGEKRNYMHTKCNGSIIVYMDDDDYYPPERISHAVEELLKNKHALCAGSSEIYIYFKNLEKKPDSSTRNLLLPPQYESKMIQCGPYGPNHATAGTFAFRSELLKQTKYENAAALAEEKAFLKNYTIPFVQLDPLKTILVFSHGHNTFDKKKMLENMHPNYCKESPKTVADFIRGKHEEPVMSFFLEKIDGLLENYEPGRPCMKPDVLENIKKIEKERNEMIKQQSHPNHIQPNMMGNQSNDAHSGKIMMNRPGEAPVELQPPQIIQLLQQQGQEIERLMKVITEKDDIIKNLQIIQSYKKTPVVSTLSKTEPNVHPPVFEKTFSKTNPVL